LARHEFGASSNGRASFQVGPDFRSALGDLQSQLLSNRGALRARRVRARDVSLPGWLSQGVYSPLRIRKPAMALVTREQLRTWVILALERRGIQVRHLEIIPCAEDGAWRVGSGMRPLMSDPAVKKAVDEVTYDLGLLYQIERRDRGERRVVLENTVKRDPMKILVVEDNVLAADLIAEALAVEGCMVVGPVGTLEDGMDILSQAGITGALLDINLHGADSFPIAYRLRDRGVPFAFVTAYSELVVPEDLRGAPRFSKPFTPWELASAAIAAFSTPDGSNRAA
jgi:CheY-like chemotaxis protein